MKKSISLLVLFLVFGATVELWAGGARGVHIGVAAADFDDVWMSFMHESMRTEARKQGVKLTIVDAKNNFTIQQTQIDTLIAQKVDAIVIVPVDPYAIGPLLNATDEAGIPLIAVNNAPEEPELSRLATYVGSDSLYAGTIQMEKVAELLGWKGDVIIIWGGMGNRARSLRTEGNHNVAAQYPGIEVVREGTGNWQRKRGFQLMENWIQSGVNFDAVVANNDEMAIGAIMALEQVDMLDDVIVAGIGATPDALEAMEEGKLDVTVLQDAYKHGADSIQAAIKAVNREELPKIWDIPFELVIPADVDKYRKLWE
ncbi:Inositol transport system sugar-binding protein [Olavius algarvensis spirochete endosymbiont]|uniref:sugar ABC transporter substrate-binding protein n=1 Tax=Olavius algarvensis spirochete endosymbiont TaxID=260710 RepID=UPI000F22A6EA|nr:sugar ABC transporter substrate-binding protein [Olavius algarvensis spirochete endosymbiont]VDB00681.1 Inositol transport system sugar-binding protein [Olavius algarvensis spirochete endosymbiont]